MTSRNFIMVGVVVLVAATAAAGYRILVHHTSQTAPTPLVAQLVPNTQSTSIPIQSHSPSTQEKRRAVNDTDAVVRRGSGSQPPERTEEATPRSEPRERGADSLPPVASLHPDDDLQPLAVVGRSFALSPSVEKGRKLVPDPEKDELLTKFAQEERDVEWARKAETHLQQVLSGIENTAVRSIECRTSICLYELAYIGRYNYDVYLYRSLEDQLYYAGTIYGYERDATAQRVSVALEIYRRRQ